MDAMLQKLMDLCQRPPPTTPAIRALAPTTGDASEGSVSGFRMGWGRAGKEVADAGGVEIWASGLWVTGK